MKNIDQIVDLISQNRLGKILELEIGRSKYIMLLFYVCSSESQICDKLFEKFNLTDKEYEQCNLFFSKKIGRNIFISQGESWHRENVDKSVLNVYFMGDNFYRYKGK